MLSSYNFCDNWYQTVSAVVLPLDNIGLGHKDRRFAEWATVYLPYNLAQTCRDEDLWSCKTKGSPPKQDTL